MEIDPASLRQASRHRLGELHAPGRVVPRGHRRILAPGAPRDRSAEHFQDRVAPVERRFLCPLWPHPTPWFGADAVAFLIGRLRRDFHAHRAIGGDDGDRQAGLVGPDHLPADRRTGRAGEADGEGRPGRVPFRGPEGGDPRGGAHKNADQVAIAAEGAEDVGLRAVDEAVFEVDRLDAGRWQPDLDPVSEAGHEGMEPVGEDRHEHGARIAADHVELVGEEHRQIERLREDQRPAGLNELADHFGPIVAPIRGGHEDGVAGGGIEEVFPGDRPWGRLEGRRSRRHVAGNGDADATAESGGGDGGSRGVDSEQAEVHRCNCSPHRGK